MKLPRPDLFNAKGVLVDLTKCMGCASCVVACKMYNDNQWIENRTPWLGFGMNRSAPATGENAMLADENWTIVRKHRVPVERENGTGEAWRYVKWQCLHCKDPACISSCFATAFRRTELGPVEFHPNLCVGCRYCMLACPFSIPQLEWDNPLPMLTKCSMCPNRIENGDAPACIAVCPTDVMTFGRYDDMLAEAKRRVSSPDGKYVDQIYGEKEAGGTLWLYISDKPFEELGFKMDVPTRAIPDYTGNFMKGTPIFGVIWFAVLSCLYLFTKRRADVKKKKEEEAQAKIAVAEEE